MTLTLGRWRRRRYRLNTSLVSLLRYRAAFGVSFFSDFIGGDSLASLLRLVWASIEGDKPDFPWFVRLAAKTRGFSETAQAVQAEVLRTAKKRGGRSAESDEGFDELDILAMMAVSGISMGLADTLPAFLIVEVVSKRTAIMAGEEKAGKKFHRMNGEEMRRLYGG